MKFVFLLLYTEYCSQKISNLCLCGSLYASCNSCLSLMLMVGHTGIQSFSNLIDKTLKVVDVTNSTLNTGYRQKNGWRAYTENDCYRRYVKRQGGVEEFPYLQSIHVRIKGGCWNQNLFDSNPDIQDESSVASPRKMRVDKYRVANYICTIVFI